MDMTRRQFALALAAATCLRPSLFEPLSPLGVPRGVVPGRVTWAHDPAAVTWDGTGSWWTDAHNDQSAIGRMVSRSIRGLTNQKKRRPGMELHLSILQSHSWARQSRIQCWGEGCDQGEPEQHNGPWDNRTPELLAPFDPCARPTVDRPGTNAGVIDHHLRFQPVHPGQSLRQDSP